VRESARWHPALLAGVVSFCLVAGCAVGPDYEVPDTEVPDAWAAAVAAEMSAAEPDLEVWWTVLEDTLLTDLIRRAEVSNRDLQVAVARVKEARALRGVAKGGLLPDVDLAGAFTRTQLSENGQGAALGPDPEPMNLWNGGFDASWEIDVFGGRRRAVEAAGAELEASVENWRDVLVSLYAEVASAYIDVRALQARIAYARSNAGAQRESVELTRTRFELGLTSALDVAQARSNLANTEAQIPQLEIQLSGAENRLAVLLGQVPGSLDTELATAGTIPDPPAGVTVGLPADLLRRRPDVRRAERQLAAQTARIGVATAELYPKFGLTGFFQLEAMDFEDLGESGSATWGFTPGFSWRLFSGGKIRGQIRAEEARAEAQYHTYENTVLRALEDAENAMVGYERERVRRARLREAVQASEEAVDLVHTQYLSGLTNFQNYLDAQRSLFNQQDQLAASEGLVVQNLIALNKALGGGWSPDAGDPDQTMALAPAATTAESDRDEEGSSQP